MNIKLPQANSTAFQIYYGFFFFVLLTGQLTENEKYGDSCYFTLLTDLIKYQFRKFQAFFEDKWLSRTLRTLSNIQGLFKTLQTLNSLTQAQSSSDEHTVLQLLICTFGTSMQAETFSCCNFLFILICQLALFVFLLCI